MEQKLTDTEEMVMGIQVSIYQKKMVEDTLGNYRFKDYRKYLGGFYDRWINKYT